MTTTEPSRLEQQERAVTAWQLHATALTHAARGGADSREAGMDSQRRLEALRRTERALQAHSELMLQRTADVLHDTAPGALLVHRNEWLRSKLTARLAELGIRVRAEAEDGADGLGMAIAEQPEVMFIEDRLPSVTAVELVHEVRQFSPVTLIAAQVEHDDEVAALLDAGASAVFSRRVPPKVMADEVESLLHARKSAPVVVQ